MVNTELRFIIFLQQKIEELYIVNKNKNCNCGSDHELFIAKLRLKLKKM